MTHDYKRNGTGTLFAALNVFDGQVIAQCQQRHHHEKWIRFLRQIDRATPTGKSLHLICDNYATHVHPNVQAWLEKHPFTPTSASWLNMAERFFRDISENRPRRCAESAFCGLLGVACEIAIRRPQLVERLLPTGIDPAPAMGINSVAELIEYAKVLIEHDALKDPKYRQFSQGGTYYFHQFMSGHLAGIQRVLN